MAAATVERVSARNVAGVADLQAAGIPFVVTDALPHLGGYNVLRFMPALIAAAGGVSVEYERQGPDGALEVRRAPLQLVMQMLDGSKEGDACLMVAEGLLGGP